jgi:SagB-type dehydrogenase family enzyme
MRQSRDVETATQTYHRLTSYVPGLEWDKPLDDPRLLQDLETNVIEKLPWFYKRYPQSLPTIALPRQLRPTTAPALAVMGGVADIEPSAADLPQLARLLHLSGGVTRTAERPYATWLFRAAGSAGGRFPLELYLAIPEGLPGPAGVHWYDPYEHALVTIGPAPEGEAATVVVTGVPWRTGWRYRERGFRHIYWDAGTMLAQLLAVASSGGLAPQLYSRFPDAQVASLVGADGVHEWPVAVISLGDGTPSLLPTGDAAVGAVDNEPIEFPLVTMAQHAGDHDSLGRPWSAGDPVKVDPDIAATAPVETVVLSRGTQRLMDRSRGLPEPLLRTSMQLAMRGIGVPHRVVVHDVGGLAPGIYRWPDLSAPAVPGELRDELYRIALDQGLAADAAFVVIAAADIGTLDDHEWREVHLAAGIVEGRLHLAAYALDASASGMTFLDSEIPALLGEQLQGVLFTCVGVPEYKSAVGGAPGEPTQIRMVTPRVGD